MGFCMDCRHQRMLPDGGPRLCWHPQVRPSDPVCGWVECARERATDRGRKPGLSGMLFEALPPVAQRSTWWDRAWRRCGRYVWATEYNLGIDDGREPRP